MGHLTHLTRVSYSPQKAKEETQPFIYGCVSSFAFSFIK